MALRDAVKSEAGAACFAEGLLTSFMVGSLKPVRALVRGRSRLPKSRREFSLAAGTVFGFIAQPERYLS